MFNKKSIAFLLTLIIISTLVVGCGGTSNSTSATPDKKKFHYAMSGLYKPFNYKDGGKLVGFDVEIGEEIARRIGMEAAPVTNPWETIIQGLKANKYDAIIGSMAITEERQEQVDFSRPYYRSGAQVFVSSNNDSITSAKDLKGKKIGVVKASTFRNVALEYTDKKNVIGYDSDVIALQDLPTGRVDAVITDQMVGIVAIKNGLKIKDVDKPLWVDEMAIPVNKGNTELVNKINNALDEMIKDGTYEKISNKWFGRNILGD
ncbi:amino acid ABC transporter substrate-binding protein, PAAT family [Desulforamulus reducens MI-1]|uniref:Amino acid ABC transporter substrate-binding protein, PAAT family n=1 Tax=Desulforamulus reducens (strain ATCC BAA-1160 / DSM 100696 / MI-1) TaxID=349161 RepID=A4J2H9_DESRM|nr:ABC transporter substrate-binding protein [Desulforamulus reducens]ABO49282.1 amino acid ABC transporter substrate-binding protein, PAAT family [Desulforamulus reducens MI-1]